MKILVLFLSFVILQFPFESPAQHNENQKHPFIEVQGTAEKKVIPDEIYININLKERFEGRDKVTIEELESSLKAKISAIGIPLENLSVADLNSEYLRVKWFKKDVLAESSYQLKVSSTTQLAKAFEALSEMQITNAYISRVHHSNIEELKKEVRIEAIKKAKEKAAYLLEAIDEKVGSPLEVRSIDHHVYRNTNVHMEQARLKTQSSQNEVQFRKIIIRESIHVKFEIAD